MWEYVKPKLPIELHKPVIRNLKKRKVLSFFIDNISGANVADMQLISKFNKAIRFLSCIIDIFNKDSWVFSLKDEKDVTITKAFQKILLEFNRKPSKILIDKGSEFYNTLFKSWFQDNGIAMHSKHNEGNSAPAERLIRTL